MHIIAYILFILQILSIVGLFISGDFIMVIVNLFFLDGNGVAGFSYALGHFFPLILGCILLNSHKKRKAKKHVVFYCNTCRDVVGSTAGKKCVCLNCRNPRREIPVLFSQWQNLPAEEQNFHLNMR